LPPTPDTIAREVHKVDLINAHPEADDNKLEAVNE
jgi:hypothetical protein